MGLLFAPTETREKRIWNFYSQKANAPPWCIIAAIAYEGVTRDTK